MNTQTFIKILTYVILPITMFIAGALIFKGCGKCKQETVTTITVDSSQHQANVPVAKPVPVTQDKPKPTYKPKPPVTVPQDNTDLSAFWQGLYEEALTYGNEMSYKYDSLLCEYNTKKTYNIDLQNDSSIYANWQPSVQGNELLPGLFTSKNRRATENNITNGCKNKFGLGGGIDWYWGKGLSFHATAIFTTKKHLSIIVDGGIERISGGATYNF